MASFVTTKPSFQEYDQWIERLTGLVQPDHSWTTVFDLMMANDDEGKKGLTWMYTKGVSKVWPRCYIFPGRQVPSRGKLHVDFVYDEFDLQTLAVDYLYWNGDKAYLHEKEQRDSGNCRRQRSSLPQTQPPSGASTTNEDANKRAREAEEERKEDAKRAREEEEERKEDAKRVAKRDVCALYALIHKNTGNLGGNAASGPIYGELTSGSMQTVIDLMKQYTDLGPLSKFIDVGSGLGKPNLHVMYDPGVAFSYGIEMERSRFMLGMTNLNAVVKNSRQANSTWECKCMFDYANIQSANTFEPFTHVYLFSIG